MFANGISNVFGFGLRQLAQNQQDLQTSLERLSTGKRVNRAADDPSAIAPITEHKAQIYSLNKELDSMSRHESFLGAKEGGLSVLSDMMIDLESLVVRAANSAGNSPEELKAFQQEANAIIAGIDSIARTTTFNGQSVMQEYTSAYLDEDLANIAEIMAADPEKAQEIAENAREQVSTTRAAIGNQLREIDSRRNVIGEELINLNASLSSIEDTDYAAETAKLVRAQILESATIAAIDISRKSAEQMIGLLESSVQTQKSIA